MENNPQSPFAVMGLIAAFILTIAVFAGVAILCQRFLSQYIERETLRTVASFLIAAVVTLGVLYAVRIVNRGK